MNKSKAKLIWSLLIECPWCKKEFDLEEYDNEDEIAKLIFGGKWDVLEGYEVMCPECAAEFEIETISY